MKRETMASIEQLKRTFGRGGQAAKLTEAEFEQRKRQQIKALLASKPTTSGESEKIEILGIFALDFTEYIK